VKQVLNRGEIKVMFRIHVRNLTFFILTMLLSASAALAQSSSFTYQGRLTDGNAPANGNYDLQFALFDSASGGAQIGQTQTITNVSATVGVFTVTLDFGPAAFSGAARFLEISTRPSGGGAFTLLTPRQQISSTPYAVRSLSSGTADVATNAQQLGSVAANQYVQTNDTRLSDPRAPTAGSSNYIQNTNSLQSAANFNIGGNGTAGGTLSANVVNAGTQFNINGKRALAVTGAGTVNSTSNTFAGVDAGRNTTPNPTTANGNFNSFFGDSAGFSNATGYENSFFGFNAGVSNSTGTDNSFFGFRAGVGNVNGSNNSFFGRHAGVFNSTESFNTFIGAFSHGAVGVNNSTAIGYGASVTQSNSTAIGYSASVTQSNSLVLGSINGVNGATASTRVGIGTTAPAAPLHIVGPTSALRLEATNAGGQQWEWQSTVLSGSGAMNLFNASNTTSPFTVMANGNVGIGAPLPNARLRVAGSVGTMASFGSTGDFGIDDSVFAGGRFIVKDNGNVGIGLNNPPSKLYVAGEIRFENLGLAGSSHLCLNNNGAISSCSSSLRYKTSVHPFTSGLNLINRLHPISFKWKTDQTLDVGLGAEDVAAVEPLLVTHNQKGEVEGVKYDRLSAVFINAFKEQQTQIEEQRAQIKSLLTANAGLNARLKAVEGRVRKRAPVRRSR
jgi:hypothetical protein